MTKALAAKRDLIVNLNEKTTELPLKYKKWHQKISTSNRSNDKLQHNNNDESENDDNNGPYNEENLSYQKFLLKKYKEESSLTPQQFQSEFIDIIPSQWTVFSVTADIENNVLYICRFHQKKTLLLRLPMKQQSDRNKWAGFLYNDVIREFKKIMELSKQNMKLDKESDEQCKQWLEKRKKLDSRMEILLKNIEDYWLGQFKVSFIYLLVLLFSKKKEKPYLIFDIFVIRKY